MTGFILIIIQFFLIMMGIAVSLSSFSKKEIVIVPKNTILHLKFDVDIPDRSSNNPFENMDFFSFRNNSTPGLNEITTSIKKA